MKQKYLMSYIERIFLIIAIGMIICGFISTRLYFLFLTWLFFIIVLIFDVILIIKKQNSKKNDYNHHKFIKIWTIIMLIRSIIMLLTLSGGIYITFSNLPYLKKIKLNIFLGLIISIIINIFDSLIIKYKRKLLQQ